ncbi:MAG: hypothetical protein WCI41_03750 [bacterium]
MTWALKRQLIYLLIVIAFVSILGYLIINPMINKAPTCFDGKANGTETGVDCGGSCMISCTLQVDKIGILWSRAFQVVPGRYNAVAYLQNKNENTVVQKINYRFRFADKDNVYIGKREGVTYVPPSGNFVVFEPALDVGNSIPVYTTFEFTSQPVWVKVPKDLVDQLKILITDVNLTNETTNPALSATISNTSLFRIPNVSVVTILYDKLGNAISASHTYIDALTAQEKTQVNFTWREPIVGGVVEKEVIPMFNIFSVKLK